jgi:hypothetical protein
MGMDPAVFFSLLDEYSQDETENSHGVDEDKLVKLPIVTIPVKDPNNVCSICLKAYEVGQKVFGLPCSHHFHIECVKPWFQKSAVCPNCRFNVNQGKAS